MKKYLSIGSALIIMLIAAACNNSTKENNGSTGVETDLEGAIAKAESRRVADPNASGGNTCLFNYQEKYDQLLTDEMVLNLTGFSKDVLDIKYSKALKNPEYHSISYRFTNKRIGKPTGMDFEMEVNDEIKLKSIKAMSLNQFKDTYRVVSQQERDVANQTIDDVTDGKSDNEEANDKIKELDERGVSKETTKGVTSIMKDAFAKVGKSYANVDGLGDAATWNSYTMDLNVIKDGVQFELMVNVSKDNEENKKMAIEVAKKILDRCK